VYERSVPLEYKRQVVSFELPSVAYTIHDDDDDDDDDDDINDNATTTTTTTTTNIMREKATPGVRHPTIGYISIVKKILNKFKVSTNYDRLTTSQRTDGVGRSIQPTASHLQEIHGIGVSEYERLVVHHLLDSLFIDEKMDILRYGSHKNLLNDILTNVRRDFGLFEVVERTGAVFLTKSLW
jgi:hypothetical protein